MVTSFPVNSAGALRIKKTKGPKKYVANTSPHIIQFFSRLATGLPR